MSDIEPIAETDQDESPGPGAMLAMARQARGMTIAEVASSLKLSVRQIDAIEREDFARLSGATFVRGFIRNYAKLLKVDPAPLFAAMDRKIVLPQAELVSPIEPGTRIPIGDERYGGRRTKVLAVLALALLGAALLLYSGAIDVEPFFRLNSPVAPSASRNGAETRLVQPAGVVLPATQATGQSPTQPGAGSEKPAAASNARQLVFSFDADAWVEVKDATGRIVLSQKNPKGTTQVVEGRAPFHLVVGNAANVRLLYNDQAVDLVPHTRVDVARFTLE